MNISLSKASDGRIHATGAPRRRGRPLSLNKVFRQVSGGVATKIARLETRLVKLQREIRRLREFDAALPH